ncbi:activator of Hsp90 ATPase-like protein [Hasllibacter halocynthiae]|uniref:Activator of Hsp90 ATPase-like protein n=1 Tax=Hasllibacter halocynthiae TaxID=595589 RepID=A0A2T0X6T4_9RHOB|nr:SRPBCC domain-containing protein [Hasllibacter halocynthiae]PRY94658.1 activator of Hsp90 ATPase-like protein [Hasllibacter halocynthiae]
MEPDHVHMTYIRCTRDALWDALTRAGAVASHHFAGIAARGDLTATGDVQTHHVGDATVLTQKVVEALPKSRLAVDFTPGWADPPTTSRVVFRLQAVGAAQRLTIEHYGDAAQDRAEDGWARFASNLKSWLETGETVIGRMDGVA